MERLRRHRDFVAVLKQRHTMRDRDIVAHIAVKPEVTGTTNERTQDGGTPRHKPSDDDDTVPTSQRRLGLAVSKSVGNAVTRNRVKRRLRILARRYEGALPKRCDIILRAKPSAATASFSQLEHQVARLFSKAGAHSPREAA